MSVINTNVQSLVANAAIQRNNRELSLSMQQLSTGKRINSASDDAAGLAISSRMTSTIRGLDQAVRNANDGISLIQTAEGAMIEITNMLQRMRELSVQSANDTNTVEDRQYLDLEFQQLKLEIDRIAENTEWNGMPVLSHAAPNNGSFEFQVGAKSGQKISVNIPDLTLNPVINSTSNSTFDYKKPFDQQNISLSYGTWDGVAITFSNSTATETVQIPNNDLYNEDFDYNDAGQYIVEYLSRLGSNFSNGYNFSNFGNGYFRIEPSSSNANPEILRISISRAGNQVDILDHDIYWSDGTASHNVTAADFNASQGTITVVSEGGMNLLNASNILDKGAADASIDRIDQALNRVNLGRASLGAVINRLTYAVDNLTNVSTNTNASRSRILDADYAKATTDLAKSQIIAQAATSMLAQANQNPQTVLQLLQR